MQSESSRAVAVNYHYVRSASPGRFRLRAHERVTRFAEQVASLAERFDLLRCRDLFGADRGGGRPRVLITFDDGARDVFEHALPVLERHGATATVFVCSTPYTEGRLLQVAKVEYLISELGLEAFRRAFYAELSRRFPDPVEREPWISPAATASIATTKSRSASSSSTSTTSFRTPSWNPCSTPSSRGSSARVAKPTPCGRPT